MKINQSKSKAASFSKAGVKGQIKYYFGDQLIPEASSFKYLGIITRSDLNWADHVNYTLRKPWKVLLFIMFILKQGSNNMKHLDCTALVRPILEYGAVCWDPYREGQVSALNRVQKEAAKFANGINESGWKTLARRRLMARRCALFKAYTGGRAWRATCKTMLPEWGQS